MNSSSMHQPDMSDIDATEHVYSARRLADIREWAAEALGLSRHQLVLSCDRCLHAPYCSCSMDAYNTDGDCLALK